MTLLPALAGLALIAGCGGTGNGDGATGTAAPESRAPSVSEDEPASEARNPCGILTQEEITRVFPENDAPIASEGAGCLFDSLRIDLKPLSLDVIKAEAGPTGWEPRLIEVDDAEWAVVRIDTNETAYQKVLDVLAGGPRGTVHLIPWGERDGLELGSAEYQGLVGLLQIAFVRLGGE